MDQSMQNPYANVIPEGETPNERTIRRLKFVLESKHKYPSDFKKLHHNGDSPDMWMNYMAKYSEPKTNSHNKRIADVIDGWYQEARDKVKFTHPDMTVGNVVGEAMQHLHDAIVYEFDNAHPYDTDLAYAHRSLGIINTARLSILEAIKGDK